MTTFITGATGFIGSWTLPLLTRHDDVLALVRRREQENEILEMCRGRGGDAARVATLLGDLSQPGLGLAHDPDVQTIIHLGAAFGWGLPGDLARKVNVDGTLEVVHLAARTGARLVLVGGYMLRNTVHLSEIGVDLTDPNGTDWSRVARRVGQYEATKIESHARAVTLSDELGVSWNVVHPATLAGSANSGELPHGQPFAELIEAVAGGRLTAVPGTDQHWLPLVTLEEVIGTLCGLAVGPWSDRREHLALDPATPNFADLVALISETAGRRPPRRRVPLRLVRAIADRPIVGRLVPTSRESLGFLRTERFDTTTEDNFRAGAGVHRPDLESAVRRIVATQTATTPRLAATAASD